jgi:peptidyl-prolyl cis-trans isomerase B (cyclophilin B)
MKTFRFYFVFAILFASFFLMNYSRSELGVINLMDVENLEAEKIKESFKEPKTCVEMITDKGVLNLELFMKESPLTAGNFKDLVERGFYNGLSFHRIIEGFVVQGGCPEGTGRGAFVDPKTGLVRKLPYEKNGLLHNQAGLVAMARASDPNSASSQFFIDLAPLPSLDPGGVDPYGYVIFGKVIEGMDVVYKIVNENVPPYEGSDGSSNPVHIKSATVYEAAEDCKKQSK